MAHLSVADVRLAAVAVAQQGAFDRAQALGAGLSAGQIDRRVRAGTWVRVLPRVFRHASTPESVVLAHWASVLWGGAGSALSHTSAAAVWRLDGVVVDTPEIVVPRSRAPQTDRVVVHRVRGIDECDVCCVEGLPVTAPVRTIIDLASVVDDAKLERALESARARRLLTIPLVLARLDAMGSVGRAGAGRVRRVAAELGAGAPAESVLEVKLARLLRARGVRRPVPQFPVVVGRARYRLDFAWPDRLVALECDGRATHATHRAFQADRARWTALTAAGWRLLVVTWDDVVRQPGVVVSRVNEALALGL